MVAFYMPFMVAQSSLYGTQMLSKIIISEYYSLDSLL